jgi:lipopolysaccharide transport system ATP-binding protein
MYVRLAFAVAAHLEPEILVLDEVLAVGDTSFQKKCLGKMGEGAREGRTILFVSHNMTAMRSLCSRAFLLEDGRIAYSGPVGDCIDYYALSGGDTSKGEIITTHVPRPEEVSHNATLRITKVRFDTPTKQAVLHSGRPMVLEMDFEVIERLAGVLFGFSVYSSEGLRLFECRSLDTYGLLELEPGNYSIRCGIPENPLNPGLYRLEVGSRSETKGLDWLPDVMTFQVERSEKLESLWLEDKAGLVRQSSDWSLPKLCVVANRTS